MYIIYAYVAYINFKEKEGHEISKYKLAKFAAANQQFNDGNRI